MTLTPAFGLRAGARVWASLLLVLAAFLFAAPATAQTYPPLTGRVVDDAHLLSPDQVAQLTLKLETLERATTRQLVVATVPDLQGREIEEYANGLFRQWHLGQGQANNGVLLLVAVAEHKMRIEVGYGLEGILTDALSSQIINRDMRPRFKDNDFAGGINAGVDSIIAQLQAPPEAAERNVRQAADAQRQSRSGGSILPIIFWAVIVLFIVFGSIARGAMYGRRYRRGVSVWGPGAGYGRGGSGLGWMLMGMALSNMNRRGGSSSWGGGGGGSWGGGGGGGFSGGGGSSGGGGASGGW